MDSNYSISYVNGQVKENPAPLTITANNVSITAGSSLPAFTATYSGFVNGNTGSNLNGTLVCTTTAANTSVTAGTYPDHLLRPELSQLLHHLCGGHPDHYGFGFNKELPLPA